MENLVGIMPAEVLPHGPTKIMVDEYIWHSPEIGIVASYTPREIDVKDHFSVFRGVDQIESFGQATLVSLTAFLETRKMNLDFAEYHKKINVIPMEFSRINFKKVIRENETFISVGIIKFYKFRQMIVTGRIYTVPDKLILKEYFKNFKVEDLLNFNLNPEFNLATDIQEIISKGIKIEKLNS